MLTPRWRHTVLRVGGTHDLRWGTVSALLLIAACVWAQFGPAVGTFAAGSYRLGFATYLGGAQGENFRDVATDRDGNMYVTGGTSSPDFPTTPGAYDRAFERVGQDLGTSGPMDVFVAKLSPEGQLVWATLPELDIEGYPVAFGVYAYNITVDKHDLLTGDLVDSTSFLSTRVAVVKHEPTEQAYLYQFGPQQSGVAPPSACAVHFLDGSLSLMSEVSGDITFEEQGAPYPDWPEPGEGRCVVTGTDASGPDYRDHADRVVRSKNAPALNFVVVCMTGPRLGPEISDVDPALGSYETFVIVKEGTLIRYKVASVEPDMTSKAVYDFYERYTPKKRANGGTYRPYVGVTNGHSNGSCHIISKQTGGQSESGYGGWWTGPSGQPNDLDLTDAVQAPPMSAVCLWNMIGCDTAVNPAPDDIAFYMASATGSRAAIGYQTFVYDKDVRLAWWTSWVTRGLQSDTVSEGLLRAMALYFAELERIGELGKCKDPLSTPDWGYDSAVAYNGDLPPLDW